MKYVAKISTMGDKLILVIPKDRHADAKKLMGKQVRIVIDDEF